MFFTEEPYIPPILLSKSDLPKSCVNYLLAQVLLLRGLIGNREHNVTPPVKLTDNLFLENLLILSISFLLPTDDWHSHQI